MTRIDLHIMKLFDDHTTEPNNSTLSSSGEVPTVQVKEIEISPVPERTDLAEPRQQKAELPTAPDEEEPQPEVPWLYGLPSQEVLERCAKLKELSKCLNKINYGKYDDNRGPSFDR